MLDFCADSESMYHKILGQLCETYGKTYTKELQKQMHGATDHDICVKMVEKLKLPVTVNYFKNEVMKLSAKHLPSAPLKKGVERLLKHLHNSKIPLALATNSTFEAVQLHKNAKPELFSYFNHHVCATDPEIDHGKPQPDIYLVAASRFRDKPEPKYCLVFEDSLIGVQAAISAGMQVIMVPDNSVNSKQTRQATLVLKSLLYFRPEDFGLPQFS